MTSRWRTGIDRLNGELTRRHAGLKIPVIMGRGAFAWRAEANTFSETNCARKWMAG